MRRSLQYEIFCVIYLCRDIFLTTIVEFFVLYSGYHVAFYLSDEIREGLLLHFMFLKYTVMTAFNLPFFKVFFKF